MRSLSCSLVHALAAASGSRSPGGVTEERRPLGPTATPHCFGRSMAREEGDAVSCSFALGVSPAKRNAPPADGRMATIRSCRLRSQVVLRP